jgi:formate hydrogenlyase subunit 6/NADH:ubiquinone oxidoreductase subunit I
MTVLKEMLENLISRPCTILYPTEKIPIPEAFRGKVIIVDDKCIGCSRCAVVCPSQCITMVADQTEIEVKGKKIVRKKRPHVRIYSCLRCGLCEQYCPSDAIHLKNELSCSGTDCKVVVK